jgi:hypothetical protein
MYLVDLDDTSGNKMTLMENEPVKVNPPIHPNTPETVDSASGHPENNPKPEDTALLAQRIIEDAKLQLDHLAKGEPISSRYWNEKDSWNEFASMSSSGLALSSMYNQKQHPTNEIVTQIDDGTMAMPDPMPSRR